MLLTDLNAFVGTAIGAATEVIETVDFLTGRHRDARVNDLTLTVAAEMIVLAGLAPISTRRGRWRLRGWRMAAPPGISA